MNELKSTYLKWQIVLYNFLIKVVLLTVSLQSKIMTLFVNTMTMNGFPLITKMLIYLNQILMLQENAIFNLKNLFHKWRRHNVTFWHITDTYSHTILTIVSNSVYQINASQ